MSQEDAKENFSSDKSAKETADSEEVENLPIGSIGSYGRIEELLTDEDSAERGITDNPEEKTSGISSSFPNNDPKKEDSSLQALVNQEQTLARDRLRQEFGREPSQEEVDRWLSEHTESY